MDALRNSKSLQILTKPNPTNPNDPKSFICGLLISGFPLGLATKNIDLN